MASHLRDRLVTSSAASQPSLWLSLLDVYGERQSSCAGARRRSMWRHTYTTGMPLALHIARLACSASASCVASLERRHFSKGKAVLAVGQLLAQGEVLIKHINVMAATAGGGQHPRARRVVVALIIRTEFPA
eukprot:SAG25_NODE_8362_length_425_cov_1.251534_1_plen_131_part_10